MADTAEPDHHHTCDRHARARRWPRPPGQASPLQTPPGSCTTVPQHPDQAHTGSRSPAQTHQLLADACRRLDDADDHAAAPHPLGQQHRARLAALLAAIAGWVELAISPGNLPTLTSPSQTAGDRTGLSARMQRACDQLHQARRQLENLAAAYSSQAAVPAGDPVLGPMDDAARHAERNEMRPMSPDPHHRPRQPPHLPAGQPQPGGRCLPSPRPGRGSPPPASQGVVLAVQVAGALVTGGVYTAVSLVASAVVVRMVFGPEPTTVSVLLMATGTLTGSWALEALVRRWAGRRRRRDRVAPAGRSSSGWQVAHARRGGCVPCQRVCRAGTLPRGSIRGRGLLAAGSGRRGLARGQAAQAGLVEPARGYAADPGYAPLGDPAAGPGPAPLGDTPLIIDTDVGGDPDDAVALVLAARLVPRLALVLTSDEQDGQRARLARYLLDLLGRGDVPVVAGPELDPAGWQFCVEGLVPAGVPAQPTDVVAAVAAVRQAAPGPVRWLGCGPMSNLAGVLAQLPEVASWLRVTQLGGALRYRDPERADHNIRRDVPAARRALATLRRPSLVTSEVAHTEQTAISAGSPAYQRLTGPDQPAWARLLRAHFDRWFTGHHRESMQHDPLALATALRLPFVELDLARIGLDARGRTRLTPDGHEVFYSRAAHYPAFRRWVAGGLDPRTTRR